MDMREKILKQNQCIARCENSLALEKLKKRRADTRRKIELGGLVIKAGFGEHNKPTILGALFYAAQLIKSDATYLRKCNLMGNHLFELVKSKPPL